MIEFISEVVAALAAGALAKTKDIGGEAIVQAYDALKSAVIARVKKTGLLTALEEEPGDPDIQGKAAKSLAAVPLARDPELTSLLGQLDQSLAAAETAETASSGGNASIEIRSVRAGARAIVERLYAEGRIVINEVVGTGPESEAVVRNLRAVSPPPSIKKN